MAVVIMPFRFAANGFTVEQLVPGDERDFGDVTEGLVSEGFVAGDDVPSAERPPAAEDAAPSAELAEPTEKPRRGRK